MNYHDESTSADTLSAIKPPLHPPLHDPRLVALAAITVVTFFALTFLDAWPSATKRRLWWILVYLTPSQLIYVMDFQFRRRQRREQGNGGFGRHHFGNQQAKSEALQRLFGLDKSVATPVQRAHCLPDHDQLLISSMIVPAGLGNWDNSCYQNSIIQGLASLPLFNDYLARNGERMSPNYVGGTHEALRSIVGKLNHSDNQGGTLWTPSALKSMNSWQQQDAQEYFSRIMDEVDRETSGSAKEQTAQLDFRRRGDDDNPSKFWQPNPFQGLLAQRVGCTRCGYAEGLRLLPFTCITLNLGMQWEYHLVDCLDEFTALDNIEGVECVKCSVLRTKAALEQILSNVITDDGSRPTAQATSSHVPNLMQTVTERLRIINEVCEAGDFSDTSLYQRCKIPAKSKVSSTKSKQAVVARAPKDLVIHVNRSIFDASGMQRKNHAVVRFPRDLNLNRWCLGSACVKTGRDLLETWNIDPTASMLPEAGAEYLEAGKLYKLRAVITHYGGHENGHYLAYGKRALDVARHDLRSTDAKGKDESWYCFNDDDVSAVSEDHVLSQGGVFMLFYEAAAVSDGFFHSLPQPFTGENAMTAPQATAVASHDEKGARSSPDSSFEPDEREPDSGQSVHGVVPGPDVVPPVSSSTLVGIPQFTTATDAHLNIDLKSEPAKILPVAPMMRTAGSLSSHSLKGQRSSNISIHSPSFVTAS